LCLFEGVATGAADGFARVAGRPAITLLHLGPGYLNGGANLHNAKRAFSPIVNIVGDHATYHRHLDAPLTSDIEALVRPVAVHVEVVQTPAEAGPKAAQAYLASLGAPGGNAFLIAPADAVWTDGGEMGRRPNAVGPNVPSPGRVDHIAAQIRAAKKPALLLGGDALTEQGLAAAPRLSAAGIMIQIDTFPAKFARGKGVHRFPRLPYFAEMAVEALAGIDLLVVAGTKHPVAFFAYPGRPSELTPPGAARATLWALETGAGA